MEVFKLNGVDEPSPESYAKISIGEAITGLDVGPIRDPGTNTKHYMVRHK